METFPWSIGGRLFHTSGGGEYSLPSARIFFPGGENILAGWREYGLPPETF